MATLSNLFELPFEGVETKFESRTLKDDSVSITVEWFKDGAPIGRCYLVDYGKIWHWTNLELDEPYHKKGANKFLHSQIPAWAKKHGVKKFTMSPHDEKAAQAFIERGWVFTDDGMELIL